MPNLPDQGENLLTSTDREPPLTATPSGRKGRMPKAEVPTSDQPGMPSGARKTAAKAGTEDKPAARKSVAKTVEPVAADAEQAVPKTASVPKVAAAAATDGFTPRRGGRRRKAE